MHKKRVEDYWREKRQRMREQGGIGREIGERLKERFSRFLLLIRILSA